MGFSSQALAEIKRELPQHRNKVRAAGARAYMKDIAPFIGIATPDRRHVLREIFHGLPDPTSDQVGLTARALWKLDEREYQYAANDLITYFNDYIDETFLKKHVEFLITDKSWWDTVDGLGSSAISPLTHRYPMTKLMTEWNKSSNIWLIRASIGHQRGPRENYDVELILSFCQNHVSSTEFFVVKAIGWALRDISKFNQAAVAGFLKKNPQLGRVAVREAERYLY